MPFRCAVFFLLLALRLSAAETAPTRIDRLADPLRGESYLLSNGQTEATFAPAIGRLIHYAEVGGPEWLWTAQAGHEDLNGWKNFGGEKAWVSPQHDWPLFIGHTFPPDPVWESGWRAEVRADPPRLHAESAVSACGIRMERDFSFDASGAFVAATTLVKVSGAPVMAGAWTVTQIAPPEAVFLPTRADSAYKGNFHRFNPQISDRVATAAPGLLRVEPNTAGAYKLGVDSTVTAIAALRGGTLLLQQAEHPAGRYPDGAEEAGFPVELFDLGGKELHYLEMELLSPLRPLAVGDRCAFTVRWSLRRLPDASPVKIADLMGAAPVSPKADALRTAP